MSGVWTGRQSAQPCHCEGRGAEYKRCTYIQRSNRRVKAHADYRWSAGSSGRRIRDTLLDNVDTASAAGNERDAQEDDKAAAKLQNGARPIVEGSEVPEQPRSAPQDKQPAGKASAVQAGAAWDKARPNGKEDNGWGPGISYVDREDWDWGAAAVPSDRAAPSNGASAGGWSRNGAEPAAASSWSEPGSNRATAEGSAAPTSAWGDDGDTAGDADSEQPDIVELRPEEQAAILPGAPTAEQIQYCSGDSVLLWQRLGVSLLLTLVTLKTTALAAGSFTFPLWYPSLQAALRNRNIRGKSRYMGLWRVAVMEVEVVTKLEPRFRQPYQRSAAGRQERLLRLLIGDASGARSQLSVPYQQRYDVIRTGEAAEVIVLSKSRAFESFKALKEIYLPECGVWVSDYPFLNREAYLECSLEIERERQQEEANGSR